MKELYNDGKSSLSASIAIVDYLFHYYGDPWIPWSTLYDEFGLPKIIKTYEKCIEVILFDSLDDSKINPELEDGFLEHAEKVIKLYKIAVVEDVYDKTKSQRLVEEIFEYHRWILNAAERGLTRTPFQERQDIDPFRNLYKTLGSLEDYFRQLEDLKDSAYVTALKNLLLLEGTLGLDLQKKVLQQINLSGYAEKLFQQPSLKLVLPDVI